MKWDGIIEAIQSIFTNEYGIILSSVLIFLSYFVLYQ